MSDHVQLRYVLLCNYAAVHDGLVHIVGGGVSVFRRTSFPASMKATLLIGFEARNTLDQAELSFDVVITRFEPPPASSQKFSLAVELGTVRPRISQENFQIPVALDLSGIAIPDPGLYAVTVVYPKDNPQQTNSGQTFTARLTRPGERSSNVASAMDLEPVDDQPDQARHVIGEEPGQG